MDLQLIETGNGGDLFLLGSDLAQVQGFENMPYIALFGGNVLQSTPQTREPNEQAFDWWGNALLMPNLPSQQFNSQTERVLNSVSLTSGNLSTIQNAVNADLDFMKEFADISVSVSIISVNTVKIQIEIKEPDNLTANQFIYIWDGTAKDLAGAPNYFMPPPILQQNGLGYILQVQL